MLEIYLIAQPKAGKTTILNFLMSLLEDSGLMARDLQFLWTGFFPLESQLPVTFPDLLRPGFWKLILKG